MYILNLRNTFANYFNAYQETTYLLPIVSKKYQINVAI